MENINLQKQFFEKVSKYSKNKVDNQNTANDIFDIIYDIYDKKDENVLKETAKELFPNINEKELNDAVENSKGKVRCRKCKYGKIKDFICISYWSYKDERGNDYVCNHPKTFVKNVNNETVRISNPFRIDIFHDPKYFTEEQKHAINNFPWYANHADIINSKILNEKGTCPLYKKGKIRERANLRSRLRKFWENHSGVCLFLIFMGIITSTMVLLTLLATYL